MVLNKHSERKAVQPACCRHGGLPGACVPALLLKDRGHGQLSALRGDTRTTHRVHWHGNFLYNCHIAGMWFSPQNVKDRSCQRPSASSPGEGEFGESRQAWSTSFWVTDSSLKLERAFPFLF